MSFIAIIDDDIEQSETVKLNIELGLEEIGSNLKVLTTTPFRRFEDYLLFIEKNDVVVLILDEKLNDQSFDEIGPVDYTGSELIISLRKHLKDIPIFGLTIIHTDEDLLSKYEYFDDIISRADFYENYRKYVPKFWRAAKNFLKETNDGFNEFNQVAKEVSSGNNSPQLINRLQVLQAKLELPFSGFDDRSSWLNEYESLINQLEEINSILRKKLEG